MPFADQLDQTVEKIIDAAIEFYMYSRNWELRDDGNYHQDATFKSPELTVTPPGQLRTAGGQVTDALGMPTSWESEYGSGPNAGSLVYGHFETTIRDMFKPWRSIPTPAHFDSYLDTLRHAAWNVSLTSQGSAVHDVGNPELESVKFLLQKIGGDDMRGDMILTFHENFCTPLPTVLHGQYAVALLAAATLCGEKEVWAKAQQDILAIADKMHAAMKDRGAADGADLSTVTALFGLAAVFPSPAAPILAGVGSALSSLEALLNAGSEPAKPTVEFAGGTPEKVIANTEAALKKLAELIRGVEDDIERKIKDAMTTVTSRAGAFDMPKPKLLEETRIDGMQVDLGVLNHLAEQTLPRIERQLYLAADGVHWGSKCHDLWFRPLEIGVSDSPDGPYEAWFRLALLSSDLMSDLAWEVKQSAEHLAIASEQTGRNEAEVEASMRRHAEKIRGGSGHSPIDDASQWVNQNR